VRLKWLGILAPDAMASPREALLADNVHYVAAPDESTKDFHKRLRAIVIANSSGPPYPSIELGCEQNGKPPMPGLPPPPAPPSSSPVLSLDTASEGSKLN
jgi:hypothetical protein